jgi:hypothetical protein
MTEVTPLGSIGGVNIVGRSFAAPCGCIFSYGFSTIYLIEIQQSSPRMFETFSIMNVSNIRGLKCS